MGATTTFLNLYKPSPAEQGWDALVNTNFDTLAAFLAASPLVTRGTWTPSIGGSATYTAQIGYWTKIDNLCTISCNLQILLRGTGSVNTVSGLPFPIKTGTYLTGNAYFGDLATNIMLLCLFGLGGQSTFQVRATAAISVTLFSSTSIFANSAELAFVASYLTE